MESVELISKLEYLFVKHDLSTELQNLLSHPRCDCYVDAENKVFTVAFLSEADRFGSHGVQVWNLLKNELPSGWTVQLEAPIYGKFIIRIE